MPGWMKQKLESRLPGGISITSDTDDTTLMAESKAELKSLQMKVKQESEKVGLKLNFLFLFFLNSTFKKLRSWHSVSSLHGKEMRKPTLLLGAPKSLQIVSADMKLKSLFPWKESYDQTTQHITKQRHYLPAKSIQSKLWFLQQPYMDVRVGL